VAAIQGAAKGDLLVFEGISRWVPDQ